MYEYLYDDIHRFHVLHRAEGERNRYEQKGLRQKLLCDNCEQQIGRYERYVSHVFGGTIELEYETHGRLVIVKNIDYKAMRLFQLSVLWRAGISSLPFFSQVDLGRHQETLRQLIASENTGNEWQYGCMMFSLLHDGKLQSDLIVEPTPSKVEGTRGYRFVFGGHLWFFFVANHRSSNKLETQSLAPTGELRLLKSDLTSAKFITEIANDLVRHGKFSAR
ncbi:hypothetical protein [Ferribacterium limneticum]|uniref:hypothetical protein n=1 Tax=Ferribacterium limneticum TaxID=76259 RepID=UPI001CF9C2F0|nr:hypothetical protein [Ferribacterium limneticum]UCV27935.1 hypothetical protein KI617_17070 [Ferribacterium limneticum]UCV31852.1 hypothetical protein KI608_17070 [Ferribacterium limneticum]